MIFETVLKKYPAAPPPRIGIANDIKKFFLAKSNIC